MLLLKFTKGPTSYKDIRTINGIIYPTFKDACYVMGLLDYDKEYIESIIEDNILLKERHRTGNLELHLDDDGVKDIALAEIKNYLRLNGRNLADFLPMPMPNQALMNNLGNLLMPEELNYNRVVLRSELAVLMSSLTCEQKCIFDTTMSAVNRIPARTKSAKRLANCATAMCLSLSYICFIYFHYTELPRTS
ncbi:helicase-like protein [Senna tora]|uniref:Helicase-like protein n=1 Tax=Senna tora TaxID=362788 RepID=A0A834WYH6_9FABA|nr:helicase-like protein [Senna tora]